MGTKIEITPPGGQTDMIRLYDSCNVTMSISDQSGTFNLILPDIDKNLCDKYPVGSDVRITQNDNIFRGWILNPLKSIKGVFNRVEVNGLSYTARTQKILVNETYIDTKISDIVKDLFIKYAPMYSLSSIVECNKAISIQFNDEYLFNAMSNLAKIAGYEWYIDEPIPNLIDTTIQGTGWQELVDVIIN